MTYDAKVPSYLKKEQQWFGSIIARPIDEDSRMNPISPSGKPMEIEASEHIAPSPTLRPSQRIQIYNQQYWWRLIKHLQDAFPLLTRLFGYYDFNRVVGIPYLVKYPPSHWSLSLLGDRLVKWVEEGYHANNKKLILDAAKLDWAFIQCHIAAANKPLSTEQIASEKYLEDLLNKKLYAQPHLYLFEMEYELFQHRANYLQQSPDYWLEHDRPYLERSKTYFFALYRNQNNEPSWKEITREEYHLLHLFDKGTTIEAACEWLETLDEAVCETATTHLQQWFQEWTIRGWLSLENTRLEDVKK